MRFFWFLLAGVAVACTIVFPMLHVRGDWLLTLLAAILILLTGVLWYAAYKKNRADLRIKLIVIGNIVGAMGVLFWHTAAQILIYVGVAFWFAAYLLLWIAPNKGIKIGQAH